MRFLNAKTIIAWPNHHECWSAGAVTIATNMAGRGTDIKLGPGVRNWVDYV